MSLRADRCQHLVDLRDALAALRVRGIDDVQQQVRLARFLQRRAERRDQFVRQVAHETDRVGERAFRARAPGAAGARSGRASRTAGRRRTHRRRSAR